MWEGKGGEGVTSEGVGIGLRSSDVPESSDKAVNKFLSAMGLVITWDEVRGWKEFRV